MINIHSNSTLYVASVSVGNPHSIDDVYETKVTPERNEESMSTFQNVKHHEEEITEESHL